jgi:hypothetical protein
MATFTVTVGDLPVTSSSPAMDLTRLHSGEALQVRGERDGSKWVTGEGSRGGFRFYTIEVDPV